MKNNDPARPAPTPRVLCAPDSFKECLTAMEAAEAMKRGVLRAFPGASVDACPIADGGEGTVAAMVAATSGRFMTTRVRGPLGGDVDARWGMLGDGTTAVIEMAAASGIELVPPNRREPLRASTFGAGQLIKAALDAGAKQILLGIGGSATTDGGSGAAQALGVRFCDARGNRLSETMSGGALEQVASIDVAGLDARLARAGGGVRIRVACDVRNPMTGPNGAAHVYGPQKGATPRQVQQLDAGLVRLASIFRQSLHADVETRPGAGAAGGMGGGVVAMLGATLWPGVELVLEAVGFDRRVKGCGLCFTGEGKLDAQSMSGKACLGVAAAAGRHGVPTVALVGVAGPGAEASLSAGLAGYRVIGAGLPAEESIRRAAELIEAAAEREARVRLAGGLLPG